ncbi:MAG: hypothetical protein A2178_04160, partial [Planctomycetes bacterium GWC2_49_10]
MSSNKTTNKKIMVAGHICLDIGPKFPQNLTGGLNNILVPGKLVNVEDAVLCTGGAVSNTGLAMAKLGADVVFNAKVGDDIFGDIIKKLVGAQRASAFKIVHGQNTSYTVIIAIPGCDRIFLHNPGTNDTFGAEDIDLAAVKECSLFHFGYPPLMKRLYENNGSELIAMYQAVKATGIVTSLDMSLPDPDSESGRADWHNILKKLLSYVDIFLPSIEEIAFMLDKETYAKRKCEANGNDPVWSYTTEDFMRLSDMLLAMGAKMAAIKSGIRGLFLRTGDAAKIGNDQFCKASSWSRRILWAPSYKAEKFGSATGAGDATIAGFL